MGGLKNSHAYYYQVQAQLHLDIVEAKQCQFYIHVDEGSHVHVCSTLRGYVQYRIFSQHQPKVPVIQYGIDNEAVAKGRVLAFLQGQHDNAWIVSHVAS